MVERKLFKTKLCVLYQRGHCPRHNCSFAHGNAELRHFVSSRNVAGKRDYRGGDLRDKLDRQISPLQRYSPERGARGRHTFHGSSSAWSLERNSDRKRRKRQHFDGPNDFSRSFKIVDREEDQIKERKSASSELKEVQSNVNMLDQRRSELRILLEKKVEEANSLCSLIQELEAHASKEREASRRIASKTKKIVKAYKRCVRVQNALKRSQARFQKLRDQLVSGTITTGGNEEGLSVNMVSDGEQTMGHLAISPQNEVHNSSSPSQKNLGVKWGAIESSQVDLTNGGGYQTETARLGKLSHLNAHPSQLNINMELNEADYRSPLGNEGKRKRGESAYAAIPSADKLKGSGSGLLVPSTSMAAHASDDLVEGELDENPEFVENISTGIDKDETTYKVKRLPCSLPLPPPVPRNAYLQYEGEEEANVDVEGLEEMVDVDIV